MAKRVGKHTIKFENPVFVKGFGSSVGKKEGEGPLSEWFDNINNDTKLGQKTWEAAESALLTSAVTTAIGNSKFTNDDIDGIYVGDLLDQSIASTFGVKDLGIPHIGLFGACSTMALSSCLASIAVESGAMNNAIAATSSHYCSAERQFRFPLEYGSKKTPTSQWTATASGALVISNQPTNIKIKAVTFGKVNDYDVKDANNMGAAMSPAAADTICNYFDDTGNSPDDFDLILTGDLGKVGVTLLYELCRSRGYDIKDQHNDCGLMIYSDDDKDIVAGASGCGCSGSVLCSYIMKQMQQGSINRVLFCGTGALMSPTSSQQGLSIPGIAHAIEFITEQEAI